MRDNWFSKHHTGLIASSIIAVLGIALLLGPMLSTVTVDWDVAAQQHGSQATSLLEATGFPHATSASVETYTFHNLGNASPESFVVDWQDGTVSHYQGPFKGMGADVTLPPGFYDQVLARFMAMQQGQVISSSEKLSLGLHVLWGSHVMIPGKNGVQVFLWKYELARWATTVVNVHTA